MESALRFAETEVGDHFELSKGPVTTMQLVMYAGASGDFNRIHYDHHFAAEAGLGGVIAHGMLTMGFLGQLVTDRVGPGGTVLELSARFVKPVRPGNTCRLIGRVVEKAADSSTISCVLDGHVDDSQVIVGHARLRLAP